MLHELLVEPQMAIGGLDDRELVLVVVDRELRIEPGSDVGERRAVAAQQAHAKGVERKYPGRRREILTLEQRGDAAAHLLGGLIGERDRQHRRGRHMEIADYPGDAVRDHTRLAAPGAGQDE